MSKLNTVSSNNQNFALSALAFLREAHPHSRITVRQESETEDQILKNNAELINDARL